MPLPETFQADLAISDANALSPWFTMPVEANWLVNGGKLARAKLIRLIRESSLRSLAMGKKPVIIRALLGPLSTISTNPYSGV